MTRWCSSATRSRSCFWQRRPIVPSRVGIIPRSRLLRLWCVCACLHRALATGFRVSWILLCLRADPHSFFSTWRTRISSVSSRPSSWLATRFSCCCCGAIPTSSATILLRLLRLLLLLLPDRPIQPRLRWRPVQCHQLPAKPLQRGASTNPLRPEASWARSAATMRPQLQPKTGQLCSFCTAARGWIRHA